MAFQYQQIITPTEVIDFASMHKEFPKCTIKTITEVEFSNLLECLGQTFYQVLLDDLADYSSADAYDDTTSYLVDDVICFQGVFYINISPITGVAPPETQYWSLAPKFSTPCYETLYCQFLGKYIAWLVIEDRIPFVWRQFRAEGLVKLFGKTFEAADLKDVNKVHAAAFKKVEQAFENLDNYIKLNYDNACYAEYKALSTSSCCSSCGCLNSACICSDDCNEDYENSGYGYQVG